MSQISRILILGASGQIGSRVAAQARALYPGAEVVGTSRSGSEGCLKFDPQKDHWSRLGKYDAVVNCIGVIKARGGEEGFRAAHAGVTQKLLENRKKLGDPRLIQVSALGANPKGSTLYQKSKGEADELLLAETDTCVVRPSIVCTPDSALAQRLKYLLLMSRYMGGVLPVPRQMLETEIQPILGQELARWIARLAGANLLPQLVEAGGPERIAFKELLDVMFRENKAPTKIVKIDKRWFQPITMVSDRVSPGLLNREQFELLFQNNTASSLVKENTFGEPLGSTRDFWAEELLLKKDGADARLREETSAGYSLPDATA